MQLITTHIGADFDALASVLAARKLYPKAKLFFPGSREESVRRLLDTGLIELDEVRVKDVDPTRLTRVVLCDTRERHRIGPVGEWIDASPRVEVIAWDHHGASGEDVPAGGGCIDEEVGATSTLMVEELQRRDVNVSATEATLLLMGIYEDTGALTYPTTAPRDLDAAAWLMRQDADLSVVRRFALQRLDETHLRVLHDMTRELHVHRIHGYRVGVVALELGRFVDELAPLVSRCLELYDLQLLFGLFGEGDRVTIIARGDLAGVNLGAVLKSFAGGGGHPTAAAARMKDVTVIEARERLLERLDEVLPPAARAADVMIRDFYVVPLGTPVKDARAVLNSRRVNAAPVAHEGESGRIAGAVTRQILDAASQHGLDDRPVDRVMLTEVEWVTPEAPVEEVGRLMLARHPRFILVGDASEQRAVGLVTRMQVLRHLYGRLEAMEDAVDRRTREQRRHRHEVGRLLDERLPPEIAQRVQRIAAVARRDQMPVYLVGGLVRDLLLGRENRDLDLVVEGDGLAFARSLADELGGRVREHRAFLTAVVVDPTGFHIDVATARSEFYRSPATLPEVQISALRQDLYRRDFTINTLAIALGPGRQPELIDYFGGRGDLERGVLRVLHSLSFIDDPTRALRAVRLELRLGFQISSETLRLIQVALEEGVFDRLSGARLRDELKLLLKDPQLVLQGIERLDELGILGVLHPELSLEDATRARLRQVAAVHSWYRLEGVAVTVHAWRLFLLALTLDLSPAERLRLADRLQLTGEDLELFRELPEHLRATRRLLRREDLRPHQVSEGLRGLSGEELLLLMALEDEPAQSWIRRELVEMRSFELRVRGRDLVAAGFRPGPRIGQALRATRRARLDGRIEADEEREHAIRWLQERPGSEAAEQEPVAERRR